MMMGTVGLELTSFINPELTWKTVSKGNRSGTRRTRKQGAKSLTAGMSLADKNARTSEGVTISESEKLGVDVLGRRFSEKVENVPIKKRRFMFRSPSPPPPLTPSLHLEASGELVDFNPALGQNFGSSSAQSRLLKKSDDTTKSDVASIDDEKAAKIKNNLEDFSGIEILAAVACSDGIGNDITENEGKQVVEESTQERIESSASMMHMEETTATLETACCSPKSSVNESKIEGLAFHDNPSAVLHESSVDKDNTIAEKSIPLPDDRLLWDLNLSMDAWPCDGGTVDYEKDSVGDISVKSDELQTNESEDLKNDSANKVISSSVDESNKMTSDLINVPVENDDLNKVKAGMEECSGFSETNTEHIQAPVVDAGNTLMSAALDSNASFKAVNTGQCLSPPGSDKSTLVSEENQETLLLPTDNVGMNIVGCISEAEEGKTVCVKRAQVEESYVASPCIPVLETVGNDIKNAILDKDDKDHDGDYDLHDGKVVAQDMDNPEPLESPEVEHGKVVAQDMDNPKPLESLEVEHVNGAEEMDICQFSPKSEDMSISDDYVMEAMERLDGASSAYTAQVGAVSQVGSQVLLQKSLAVGMGSHSELQAGYDSQFEDGELRESDVQYWEEAEQVDYDTDFEEEKPFGLETENVEQKLKVERGSDPDVTRNYKNCETGETLRENSVTLKMISGEVPDGETKKIDCLDGSTVRDYDLRVDLSKVSKRESLSRVEGSLSSDAIPRRRSDDFNGSYPRAEREASSDKFMERDRPTSQMRGKSPGGGHFYKSSANYWDFKRHHHPLYHGSYNFGRTRPKSVIESRGYPMAIDQAEAAGVSRPDNRIGRQFMGSNAVHRPFLRRRSPIERDDSYGMHARMPTVRDTSPDRTRFRRYPQGLSRGIRDECLRHIPDDGTEHLSRMPHHLGRRERSISPHGGRPHYTVTYKRTRSRSRSRSPIGWSLQRDRIEGSRRGSRSPDYRCDARVDRVRLPLATKRFGVPDYGDEFISPPRSRISPQRNFRMFEDRKSGIDHFSGRKSPVRMFRQGQRFDQVRPIRRMNSDDYFSRPMVRPRRIPDMASGGKGCRYEGNDDDKHDSRYEMIHRVRRYDTDGAVRQFRYNTEDSYVANSNTLTVTNAIGVSSRRPDDAPRTAGEDRSFKMQP